MNQSFKGTTARYWYFKRSQEVKLASLIRWIPVLLLFIAINALGQGASVNFQNYKFLRKRLVNDFTVPGIGQGKSLVAERRAGADYPGKLIFHADETSNMGYYIATLATEYKLLKENGQSTYNTLLELGYALQAVNRLDQTAEANLRNPSNPGAPLSNDLNGFFIRSDVSHTFYQDNSAHLNSGTYGSSQVNGITSSYYDGSMLNPQPLRESLDQVLNLMMGLSFVSKYVNDSLATITYPDNIKNYSAEAKRMCRRMVFYMKQNGWKIKDPVSGQFLNNAEGGEAQYLSYGFAEAACAIENEFSGTVQGFPEKRCTSYHDITTSNNYFLFQHTKTILDCPQGYSTPSTNCRNCQELYKPMMLAAIGSSYYQGGVDVTDTTLKRQGINTEIQIIPLIHSILWNKSSSIPDSILLSLLNKDLSGGAYNRGGCDYPDFEWSAPVRWRQLERRGAGCSQDEQDLTCFHFFPGEYNGLDYMLLFNLYCLSHPSYVSYELEDPLSASLPGPLNVKIMTLKDVLAIIADQPIKSLRINSIDGKEIFMKDKISDSKIEINTSAYASGIYILNVSTASGQLKTIKLYLP